MRKQGSHALLGPFALKNVFHAVALLLDREIAPDRDLVERRVAACRPNLPDCQIGRVDSCRHHGKPQGRSQRDLQQDSRNFASTAASSVSRASQNAQHRDATLLFVLRPARATVKTLSRIFPPPHSRSNFCSLATFCLPHGADVEKWAPYMVFSLLTPTGCADRVAATPAEDEDHAGTRGHLHQR